MRRVRTPPAYAATGETGMVVRVDRAPAVDLRAAAVALVAVVLVETVALVWIDDEFRRDEIILGAGLLLSFVGLVGAMYLLRSTILYRLLGIAGVAAVLVGSLLLLFMGRLLTLLVAPLVLVAVIFSPRDCDRANAPPAGSDRDEFLRDFGPTRDS